jgi:hypothetical protein
MQNEIVFCRAVKNILLTIATLASVCCATAQPETVWRNAVDPRRNYVHDSQECEVIANALVASIASPLYRLAFYNKQWDRCMVGRDWEEVLAKAPTPNSAGLASLPDGVDPRWMRITQSADVSSYLDTTRIDRRPDGVVAVWVSAQYATTQDAGGFRFQKMISHREYDCAHQRTRVTAVAIYDAGQKPITSAQLDAAQWIDPIPESSDEAMLRGLCRAKK